MSATTKIVGFWLLGLLTLVPYCIWHLVTDPPRESLALLVMVPVGWVFFYFPTVMPLLAVHRIRRLMKLLDDPDALLEELRAADPEATEKQIVAFLARENGIPRFATRWLYRRLKPALHRALVERADADPARPPVASPPVG